MLTDLDRIEIEATGADPVRLARAIHRQLPDMQSSVPVHDIARALDIEEIREERLSSIEGCLLTDRRKSFGAILVNAASNTHRRRYTVAHELGHFLNERHRPITSTGFVCTTQDMGHPLRRGAHLRQEQEANAFAIELLAPEKLIQSYLRDPADLEAALRMSDRFKISREAAARRYVALHEECLAVVFSKDDRVRYVEKGDRFPRITVWVGDPLSPFGQAGSCGSDCTDLIEVSAGLWLANPDGKVVFAQRLQQAQGFAVTLLLVESEEDDGE